MYEITNLVNTTIAAIAPIACIAFINSAAINTQVKVLTADELRQRA